MKKKIALILLTVFIAISCTTSPNKKIETFVYDNENILTDIQENQLQELFALHEKKTTNEIVLLTTDSFGNSKNILMYSIAFTDSIGIGKKGLNNGILIVVSKKNRQTRISTGYGIENILKDEIVKKYIDSLMIPEFKIEKYYEGISAGSNAIIGFLEKPENKVKKNKK